MTVPSVEIDRIAEDQIASPVPRSIRDRKAHDRTRETLLRAALRERLVHAPTGIGLRVGDIGSTDSRWRTIVPAGVPLIVVPLDRSATDDAPRPGTRVLEPSGLRIPLPDEHLDAVIAGDTLANRPYGDKRALVRGMWRVLRPGGTLFLFERVVREKEEDRTSLLDTSELLELLFTTTGGSFVLHDLRALRTPGENVHREAYACLIRLGASTTW